MPAYMHHLTERVHAALAAVVGTARIALVAEPADDITVDDAIRLIRDGGAVLTVQSGPCGVGLNEEGWLRPNDDSSWWTRTLLLSGGTSAAQLAAFATLTLRAATEGPESLAHLPALPPR